MASTANRKAIERLQQQADAVRLAAEVYDDDVVRACAVAAADTIQAIANKRTREEPILALPGNASDSELREARLHQAVSRGIEVYLPSWREGQTGLPNLLLRSALFAAANLVDEAVSEETIATQGDTSITLTGFRLTGYDKRVFAVCLDHYRQAQPLSTPQDIAWIRISYWQFAKALGVEPGTNVFKAVRGSLIRLNAAHLRLRIRRRDIPLPSLIDVAFDDGHDATPGSCQIKGADIIAFRIPDSMAALFGPQQWTAVSKSALHDFSGLPAWLASFYSTHAKPYPLQVSDLRKYSGVVCDLREFRRRLKTALDKLQGEDIPAAIRVAGYELQGTVITVRLTRWQA
ncbi:plasmid replication initiator TrfA [Vogesella amnigena]|uniref:Plasmid replication initiator TrfA n=1 Tax=Vogesella amnigena TaxID=1507449 RepID=A0ABV7TYK5_9NEIS